MQSSPVLGVAELAVDHNLTKLDYIDAVRGIAVLGVIFTHCVQQIKGLPEWFYNIFYSGMYGVQLFFIVSAFTMFHSYYGRQGEPNAARNFFIRRFFRIAPMFYLGILLYIPIKLIFGHIIYPWYAYVATALFLHGLVYEHINTVVPGGWSIGVEFMFYAFVPLLARWITGIQNAIVFLGISVLLMIGAFFFASSRGWPLREYDYAFYWFPNQLVVFALGFVLYFWVRNTAVRSATATDKAILWGSVLALFAVAAWHPGGIFGHMPFAALFLIFCYEMAMVRPKIFVNKWMQRVGVGSFSIYIWHFAMVTFWVRIPLKLMKVETLPIWYFPILVGGVIACSMILASFSELVIEKPFQAVGKRLIRRLSAS